jgi:hypothetical protein
MTRSRELAELATAYDTGTPLGFRNRIINGNMVIDQRNAGASVTVDGASAYTVDRFFAQDFSDAALSVQQIADAPTGFVNSLRVTVTTADASLGATQGDRIGQRIEGFNVSDFGWGTANAQAVTLSFWVKSSLTGTFGGSFQNAAGNRAYPFTYSISAANTWEQKSITVAGDTTGTWLTTNGQGILVNWSLGMGSTYSGTAGAWAAADLLSSTGSVSVVGTLSATWQITGVQLEAGSVATPFERRPYGTELALCQRYYEQSYDIGTVAGTSTLNGSIRFRSSSSSVDTPLNFTQIKRSAPTVVLYSTTGASGNIRDISAATNGTAAGTSIGQLWCFMSKDTSGVAGNQYGFHYTASAEL